MWRGELRGHVQLTKQWLLESAAVAFVPRQALRGAGEQARPGSQHPGGTADPASQASLWVVVEWLVLGAPHSSGIPELLPSGLQSYWEHLLRCCYYCPHFTDEETEARGEWGTPPC